MDSLSLIFLVFVLGLRHGIDADHLAFIDGQIRYNWRIGSPIARWVGTLFSLGHGLVVAGIAIILGAFVNHFTFPAYFDTASTWVSIVSLFVIGSLNLFNLLRTKSIEQEFLLSGLKGRLIPKFAKSTTNPLLIILIGGMFALAADTVSQTSAWALAAGHAGGFMSVIVGCVFMLGMMLTDTVDSFITYQMMKTSGRVGRAASRLIGWVIVFLAYGVCFYETITFFGPFLNIDFEVAGAVSFFLLILCFTFLNLRLKSQNKSGSGEAIK
ncbi:sodium:proton antiporter [Aneurinibacillus sp. Ricciae_BoGa-3]|uniref:HoxN/HupN/NixA family nickel/cobalt transporter n=1 Tax=Aneurinibacillus sp. Ricciae_BoGa-3 TaxID=3022697 RepID=UPI0023407082|nr:sodium:proton antiporter [Aneurinibacillus sp. Ricciae_BoGa-3]WCK56468.1 sodium:proton antiporter [Aneurinibacillus sp. Ricciae_BoGa-3]